MYLLLHESTWSCQLLTKADKGGGGVSQKLTFADRGGGSTNPRFWLTKYVNSPFQLLNMNIYWHGHTLKTMYVPSTPWEHLIMPIAHKSWQGGRGGQPKAYICWQRGGGLPTPVFGWRNMWTAPNLLIGPIRLGRKKMRRLTLSQMERKSKCLSYSSQPYPMYSCIPNANIVSFE